MQACKNKEEKETRYSIVNAVNEPVLTKVCIFGDTIILFSFKYPYSAISFFLITSFARILHFILQSLSPVYRSIFHLLLPVSRPPFIAFL